MTLGDLTGLSKPLTKLVEVVAQGIGAVYNPHGTIRQAKADAKASLILADADIQKRELLERAFTRIAHVEIARQENIERIVEIAQQKLPPEVDPAPVQQDWINHFFSSVQDVSSEDLQKIWGKVLAGEVAHPGAYARRTIEFLKTVSAEEAEVLRKVLSVCFTDPGGWHFFFEDRATLAAVRAKVGNIDWQRHLIDIGLVSSESAFWPLSMLNGRLIDFDGVQYLMRAPAPPAAAPNKMFQIPELVVTTRSLTSIGQQISTVASDSLARDASLIDKINVELAPLQVSIERQQA